MLKALLLVVFIFVSSILLGCNRESSGPIYKGEGENWSAELITTYNFLGKEMQSIRLKYLGEEKTEEIKNTDIIVESPDFLGWGIGDVNLDENGLYDSGVVVKYDKKNSISSNVTLKIEGQDSEVLFLSSNSQ